MNAIPVPAPQPPLEVVINGKFLSAGPTGVHRVAEELVRRLISRVEGEAILRSRLNVELWVPRDGAGRAAARSLPARVIGPLTGIPWEQLTLPVRSGNRLVLSLCNVGPVAKRHAVTMFHDAQVRITPRSYSLPFRIWYWFHQSLAGRRHRRLLTVSDFSRTQLAHFGIAAAERTGVILNGIDHFAAIAPEPAIVADLGLDAGRYVIALANTQVHKNIALLLAAFASPSLAGIKLVLFGSAQAADFEALGHHVPPNVVFAGRVNDGQLRALYENALCMAFPSLTEGFGLPPLEAMSAGCPAIVAPEGALPEVCGDAAIYLDAHDPAAWTKAIADLADDDAVRARLVAAGRAHAANFTWDASTDRLIEELLRLVPR